MHVWDIYCVYLVDVYNKYKIPKNTTPQDVSRDLCEINPGFWISYFTSLPVNNVLLCIICFCVPGNSAIIHSAGKVYEP